MKLFESKLLSKKNLTKRTLWLSFNKPEGFVFKSGQFLSLKIPTLKVKPWRSYSILNTNSDESLEFLIGLNPNSESSKYLKTLKVGDEVVLRGPFGKFIFNEKKDVKEFWFICTGTGLAPLLSMIKNHLPKIKNKNFVLLFGNNTKEDLYFFKELKRLEEAFSNFVYLPSLTREEWIGLKGRVYNHLPKNVSGKSFYICGNKNMIMDTKNKLVSLKVSEDNIFFESYT